MRCRGAKKAATPCGSKRRAGAIAKFAGADPGGSDAPEGVGHVVIRLAFVSEARIQAAPGEGLRRLCRPDVSHAATSVGRGAAWCD